MVQAFSFKSSVDVMVNTTRTSHSELITDLGHVCLTAAGPRVSRLSSALTGSLLCASTYSSL